MAHTTIRRAIMEALEDLSKSDFYHFCFELRDHREEPRLRRRAVEGKSVMEITDLMVSAFTESRALTVTLEILRLINCHEVGETLESNTKACVDKGDPTFRKNSDGKLEINQSQEALKYAASQWSLKAAQCGTTVKKPEQVEAEAKARVLSEGGDPCNNRLVLSRCTIEFGKYKHQTFKWLLENDMSYAALLVANHQKEREHTKSQDPLMVNKDYLTRYATAYPEVLKEVRIHSGYQRAKDKSLQPGQEGKALVGFGRHRSMTLEDLYESKELTSYVNFIRNQKSTCEPGSRMEDAVKYILQRDQQKAAAASAFNRPASSFVSNADRRKQTTRNQFQSTKEQSNFRTVNRNARKNWRRPQFSPLSYY